MHGACAFHAFVPITITARSGVELGRECKEVVVMPWLPPPWVRRLSFPFFAAGAVLILIARRLRHSSARA